MRVLTKDEEHRLAVVNLVLDTEISALVCKKCQYCTHFLPQDVGCRVTTHLREKHQTTPERRYGLTKYVRSLRLPDPAQLPLRPDGSRPHPHLRVYKGYACNRRRYLTISLDLMKRHDREHLVSIQVARPAIDDLFQDVLLQSWVHGSSRNTG
jgi:hypothetical protein